MNKRLVFVFDVKKNFNMKDISHPFIVLKNVKTKHSMRKIDQTLVKNKLQKIYALMEK